MIFYDEIYIGDDQAIAKKNNLLNIITSLNKASKDQDYFVLLSSANVFDRSYNKFYSESDIPNSKQTYAKLLIEAERKVLEYKYGIVARVQDRFSSFYNIFNKMIGFKEEPIFAEEGLWMIMDDYVDIIIKYILFNENRKLFHVFSNEMFSPGFIWFLLNDENFSVDSENCNFNIDGYMGGLKSEFLQGLHFYKDLIVENKKRIMTKLNSFKEFQKSER